jgi:cytochrome P450
LVVLVGGGGWEEVFDPERKEWTDGSKNAFFSFGLGLRACIGEDLARKEIKTGALHALPTGF